VTATPIRCTRCGSAFLAAHMCHVGHIDRCWCTHPRGSHHRTDTQRFTYCTVWDGPASQCRCDKYAPMLVAVGAL
jgi:hypothetical protein